MTRKPFSVRLPVDAIYVLKRLARESSSSDADVLAMLLFFMRDLRWHLQDEWWEVVKRSKTKGVTIATIVAEMILEATDDEDDGGRINQPRRRSQRRSLIEPPPIPTTEAEPGPLLSPLLGAGEAGPPAAERDSMAAPVHQPMPRLLP